MPLVSDISAWALGQSSGSVLSGDVASGLLIDYSRIVVDDSRPAGSAVSGVIAVALGSGGGHWLPASRQSGLRMPALGVNQTNALSGQRLSVVLLGTISVTWSGGFASGDRGALWVGSGGLLVNLSGFMGGASSGPGVGAFSGSLVQRVAVAASGRVLVCPSSQVTLATLSGTYLRNLSGAYPVSGLT